MSWKDSFEPKGKQHNQNHSSYYNPGFERDHPNNLTFCSPAKSHYAGYILKKVWSDRKLRIFLIISILLLKFLTIFFLTLVIPVIGEIIDKISFKGFSEVINSALDFLSGLWKNLMM